MNLRDGDHRAGSPENTDIDMIASVVYGVLGVQAQPRLKRRMRDWPQLIEEPGDICQLAAVAFIEALRRGRIAVDGDAGVHTAQSVAAYLWGICSRILASTLRRSQRELARQQMSADGDWQAEVGAPVETSLLDELLGDGPGDGDRLWEVLGSVAGRCRPEDIIVTYLLGCGVTVAEIRRLLGVSVNTPANAVRRVGQEIRRQLGLDPVVASLRESSSRTAAEMPPPLEETS